MCPHRRPQITPPRRVTRSFQERRECVHLCTPSAVPTSSIFWRWARQPLLQANTDGGQVTVLGKGGVTRAVRLPASVWKLVNSLRNAKADPGDPVFRSRKKDNGGVLRPLAVLRVVRQAASRAGIELPVSPHWFRHAHASHALDRGAPIHLVQTPSDMPASPPLAVICMPDPTIAPAVSRAVDGVPEHRSPAPAAVRGSQIPVLARCGEVSPPLGTDRSRS